MSFNIDQTYENLLLVLRPYIPDIKKGNQIYLKFWDSKNDKMIYEDYITNPNLFGIFASAAFAFVGNHLYYNNNVIKIRIDNMTKRNMTEEQLFCEYHDIFPLGKDCRVKINSPL